MKCRYKRAFCVYCTYLIRSSLSTERCLRLWIQRPRQEMVFLALFHIQFRVTCMINTTYDVQRSCNHQIIHFTCVLRTREQCSTNKRCQSRMFCIVDSWFNKQVPSPRIGLMLLNSQYFWSFSFININVLFRCVTSQKSWLRQCI